MTRNAAPRLAVCRSHVLPVIDTASLFDGAYRESRRSPVSEFFFRLREINKLAPAPGGTDRPYSPLQAQLVLLGAVGAVDSFVRSLIVRVLRIDDVAQSEVESLEVAYAAAHHLPNDLLPEALCEKYPFSSSRRISEALKELLGIKGNLEPGLGEALVLYDRLCQLRHCAVHRFGKLGPRNAVALGMAAHGKFVEKPLSIEYVALQQSIEVCTVLVTSLNNYVFREILRRIPRDQWALDYSKDRKLFMLYYSIFADKESTYRTAAPKVIYQMFLRDVHGDLIAQRSKLARRKR